MLGTCNLLVFGLPPGWRLLPGAFPPEADRWRVWDDTCWALEGRASFRALPPPTPGTGRPAAVEGRLEVRALPAAAAGTPPGMVTTLLAPAVALATVEDEGALAVGGHTARFASGTVAVGLGPWRRRRPAWVLTVPCDVTGRVLRLLLSGEQPAPVAEARAAVVAALRCH